MRILFWLIMGFILTNLGCQSAYRINPELLPKLVAINDIRLIDADNSSHKFSDIYQAHQGTIIIFWQTKCPCVKRYQKRINNLFEHYSKNDLAFIHVSSNTNESFIDVKNEYKNRQIPLPILRDEGGALAKLLGAKGTPTAALIDRNGQMVFMGWIDNEHHEKERGRIAYLENALNEFIQNQPISVKTSPMFGCAIR